MNKLIRSSLKIQRYALGILLGILAVSAGLNLYLLFGKINLFDEGHGKEETFGWIGGHSGGMWNDFSIGLTPNRAVLSLESDQRFNVSVKGSRWAPFDFGPRPFYFKIYDRSTDYKGTILGDEPKLNEETVFASKSKDELNYVILANFTVLLDTGGTHVYTIVGASWSDVTLDHWECIATFALNIV